MKRYKKIATLTMMLFSFSAWAHEGAVYPEVIRNILTDVDEVPKSLKIGKGLQSEVASFTSNEVHALRVEALRNQTKNEGCSELLPGTPISKPVELKYEVVANLDQEVEYFSDGHVHKQATKVIRCESPYSNEIFQVRIAANRNEKIFIEPNRDNSAFVIREVYEDKAAVVINGEKVFIPCSLCFRLSPQKKLIRISLPFRSYEKERRNDFFESVSWRWFGKYSFFAQLEVTREKYGVNVIADKRVYVFDSKSTELSLVDTGDIEENKSLDFDTDPIQLTVIPVKDGKGENLFIRIKGK